MGGAFSPSHLFFVAALRRLPDFTVRWRHVLIVAPLIAALCACGGTSSRSATPTPAGWRTYYSKALGFSVSLPPEWRQQSGDPTSDFTAKLDDNDDLKVRVVPLPQPIDTGDLASQKQIVDLSFAGSGVNIIDDSQVTISQLNGRQVVYTSDDARLGTLYHVRVVLFNGPLVYNLLFQATPFSRFQQLAPVFDQIRNSLRIFPVTGLPPSSSSGPSAAPASPALPGP